MTNGPFKLEVLSPLNGTVLALAAVPDPVFAGGMMGAGLAIVPRDGRVVAAVTGTVITLHDSGHAMVIRTDNGVAVLVHVGIDTVSFGDHFQSAVKAGDRVAAGQLVTSFDYGALGAKAPSLATPVVILEQPQGWELTTIAAGAAVIAGSSVIGRLAPGEHRFSWSLPVGEGLHARPAAAFVSLASTYAADIELSAAGRSGNAKSILEVMRLGVDGGETLHVRCTGPDAQQAATALQQLLADHFGNKRR